MDGFALTALPTFQVGIGLVNIQRVGQVTQRFIVYFLIPAQVLFKDPESDFIVHLQTHPIARRPHHIQQVLINLWAVLSWSLIAHRNSQQRVRSMNLVDKTSLFFLD